MDTRRHGKAVAKDIQTNGRREQEETYQKIQAMKDMYYYQLTKLHKKTVHRLEQAFVSPNLAVMAKASYVSGEWEVSFMIVSKFENLSEEMKAQFYKEDKFKTMIERYFALFQLPKEGVTPSLKHKVVAYEKYLIKLTSTGMLNIEQDGGDWQEEVYQKLKAMKEKYFPRLADLRQRIAVEMQRPDGPPDQATMTPVGYQTRGVALTCLLLTLIRPLPEGMNPQKFKGYKRINTTVKRMMSLLQIPKEGVTRDLKGKLGTLEQQIKDFVEKIPPSNQNQEGAMAN